MKLKTIKSEIKIGCYRMFAGRNLLNTKKLDRIKMRDIIKSSGDLYILQDYIKSVSFSQEALSEIESESITTTSCLWIGEEEVFFSFVLSSKFIGEEIILYSNDIVWRARKKDLPWVIIKESFIFIEEQYSFRRNKLNRVDYIWEG